jgi:oligopeptidase B
MLDVNRLAEGHEYFSVRGLQVSPGEGLLAYATDSVGRRFYDLRFKDLATGETLADEIPDVTGLSAWAEDDRTVFYVKQHPETLRWYRIYRHVLGTDPAADELVYEETDETFSAFVFKTKSKKYLMIASSQTLSNEFRYLAADDPAGEFTLFEPRRRDHEYTVDHFGDHFYVRTNLEAKNFRLMKTPVAATGVDNWQEVVAHRGDVLLQGFEVFDDYLVLEERKEGLNQLRVMPWDGGDDHYLDFGEPAYDADPTDNHELDTAVLRYRYTSLTTPDSVYDYDMSSREKTLRKEQEVLGGFDRADYVTERLHAPARDGKRIPLSVVYRKDFAKDGSHPLLLYGYGSYGANIDPRFSSPRLSLLDRGFVFVIAHVRGSQTLGRDWYEDGKLFHKMNTFTDFIDAAEYLLAEGYTSKDKLFAEGRSAGGLLMGAVTNLRPDLWEGVIAGVPFVDVVTTMLEPDIPLTTGEYDEWGDPNDPQYFDYMLSYSPYDNTGPADYPNLLVTTGLHDSQVQYWEPAKWVAKLRTVNTGDDLVLLETNLEAGHGGASGRFKRHKETALTYAFLLDLLGITE